MRGVRGYVKDLLRHRRPRPFEADAADADELRAAIALRAAGPDNALSEEFVEALHQRLGTELDDAPPQSSWSSSRRRFVASVAAASAASVALGAGLNRALTGDDGNTAGPPPADETVVPDRGEWQAVVAAKDLPEGGVRPFDLGAIVGFVHRTDGQVHAVSGVCTHLYCKLALDAPARQLKCPCHNAAFALDGAVLHHRLPIPLRALPKLIVRESGGVVQVFAPPRPA
jgi:cytochrome b6-f complex iron-sulfur subunit